MSQLPSIIDWETLKPEILRLLSAGKSRKEVILEVSTKGSNITKSQLEYQLKCWGQRTNLTGQAWRYASYKVQKRARSKKTSVVFFNGALIPKAKVVKETRRHDRPTLLPMPGDSPKCPEGFDLVICTPAPLADSPPDTTSAVHQFLPDHTTAVSLLPWLNFFRKLQELEWSSIRRNNNMIDLSSFTLPAPSQFPGTLIELCGLRKIRFDLDHVDKPYMALLGLPDNNQTVEEEVAPRRVLPLESQVAILLGLQIFQISNNLSTGSDLQVGHDGQLQRLGNTVKLVAKTTSNWKALLTAGAGATSRALIEQLFAFSIISRDKPLTELMLQIGADPDQQIFDSRLGMCLSALDYTIADPDDGTINLLLDSGAVFGQMSLKHAFEARDLGTADLILRSNQSLDLNFNYLDTIHPIAVSRLSRVKLERATLLGLVCLDISNLHCSCDGPTLFRNNSHQSHCTRHASIACLEFLIREGATITLDTMMLASFNADVATLQFLMQHGGSVDGHNLSGFSCLDAASLRNELQHDILSLLLASGATTNITRTPSHDAFDYRASLLHRLLMVRGKGHVNTDYEICQIVDLLIKSGADINHRVVQVGSPAELALAYEKFLWSQSTHYATPADPIADSKAETSLEYAIALGCIAVAHTLINRQCYLTGREMTLAVKAGSVSVLKALIERGESHFNKEKSGRTLLQLGLRWGHEKIVQYLLDRGVKLGAYDLIDALQYPGKSILSTETQTKLIQATPELDRLLIFGFSLLELCCLKFNSGPVRYILRQFPAAFDSGALSAIAIRSMTSYGPGNLNIRDVQDMVSRRTPTNCDWEKENRAILIAAMCCPHRPDMLCSLAPPGTTCTTQTARIPREYFSLFLNPLSPVIPWSLLDPTHFLGCQDWVSCSPLVGFTWAPEEHRDWPTAEDMFDYLLACSYAPDALTVVAAAARGNMTFLRRFKSLENWRDILSIDGDNRPLWCPTALQVAASQGKWNEETVELLLEAGTSVNEPPAAEPIGECLPRTALQAAVDSGNLRLTNLFIQRGARINAPAAENSGATALQLACIHGYLAISLRLLELGADVNARGARKNGRTALEGAAEHGRIDTIQLLLNHGVSTEGPYREPYVRAVLYAESKRHFAAAVLLKEHREWSAEDEECYNKLRSGGSYKE